MLNVVIIVTALVLASYLAFSKRLAGSSSWKATVTPLASIMGSGFLVSAPLLAGIVGNLALFCMAALLLVGRPDIALFRSCRPRHRKTKVAIADAHYIVDPEPPAWSHDPAKLRCQRLFVRYVHPNMHHVHLIERAI
jgi:hypothetical protein